MRNKYNVYIKKTVSILTALTLILGMCGIMVISVSAAGTPTALSATAVTYNSLNANWDTVAGTTHYYLDVATDSSFTNMLTGYNAKDMGTVTSCSLTGLSSVTNYFYRVKADSGSYSNIVYVQTPAKNGAYSAASTATSGNEYSVSTAAQLKLLADTVNAGTATYNGVTFKLAGNIDLTDFGTGYDSGAGWKPIGVSDSWSFRGQFDGNGYVVKNLYINRPDTGSIGLFGFMNGATAVIKNVGVVDCNIIGDSRVGAIVGWAYGSGNAVISECFSTGSVSGKRYVGGIVGEAETDSFTVKNCYSTADITGTRTDYNTAEGDAGFGGIVGYIYAPGAKTTTIANCYSTGDIAGPNCAGGIVGGIEIRNTSGITITVKNCVALCGTIKTTYSVSTTEETDGVYTGTLNGLRAVSLQNRVIGSLWENTVSGTCSYTFTHTNLYSLDTIKMYYYSTTVATTTSDGTSVTSSDLASNAHNWTNSAINDAGGTIPAGSVTYFDSVTAGNPDSVWYYYQNKQVLPVLTRYADNYPQVLIVPAALDETVPFATDVYANSTNVALFVGNTLIGAYTYNQNGAGTESGSTYQWYRYDIEKGGTGILVGTGPTYNLVSADFGKYLSFEVTPSNGTKIGSAVESDRVGPVQAPTYAATVNVKIDDIAANITGIVALKNGSTTLIANVGSTGEYTVSAANGTYDIYINGADSGTDITVADAAASVTVNYYTVTVNTRVDGSASDVTGSVELKQGGTTISIAVDSGTGVFTASAANGTYDVYINGVDTGTDIAINNGTASATVNYYTVSFAAADAGTASGSTISATAGGSAISSGAVVLMGKTVVITAAGAGSSTYTYLWSGTGTSGETTSVLTMSSLSGVVNATCTVTGTTTYGATVNVNLDGIASSSPVTGNVELWQSGTKVYTMTGDSGVYTASAMNGTYNVYIGGSDTGKTVTISSGTGSVTVDYYTVSFSAVDAGTASGSTISATAGGTAISSGATVLAGKTVVLTTTGAGADYYSYFWSGSGANGETSSTITISSLNKKIDALCTVTGRATPTTYSVSLYTNGGSIGSGSVTSYTYGVGAKLPTDVTRTDCTFSGWYENSDFSGSPVTTISASDTGDKVFYARWNYTVSGTVADHDGGNASGATVTIRGNNITPKSTSANSSGYYSFSDIPAGEYNIVAVYEGVTQTIMITVTDSDISNANIQMPEGAKNSVLEIASDTPDIVVGFLNQQFTASDDTYIGTSGNTVEIKLAVDEQSKDEANGAGKIQELAGGQTIGMYLDMTLTKTKTGTTTSTETLTSSERLLKIIVPYDFTGKTNVIVYRYHNSMAQAMTEAAYSSDTPTEECYMVNTSGKQVIIWTKSFSTYAISFLNAYTISYDITVPTGLTGGSISPSGTVSVTKGGSKTFTITPYTGYVISDVLVDGKSVGSVSSYTFSNITAAHTISAVFAKSDKTSEGLPYYYNDSGDKVFIGFASDDSGTMKYIAPDGETVLFALNPKDFADISGHWAKSYINFVTEREIFVGTGNNVFSPDTGMTRAMLATVIGRLYERSYGALKTASTHTFTDCDYSSWYGSYIDWCSENGIIQGVGGGLFQPDRQVTRQEMVTMLYRFAEFMKLSTSTSTGATPSYSDASSIASWAQAAALYCQETGIITGRNGSSFAPTETATRAEVAAILERFIELVV